MAGVTCTSVKAPLMLKATNRSNICCHPSSVFFRDVPAYFSKTMPSHILQVFQQRGFIVTECRNWTGLPAVQTCLPLKMCGTLWSKRYDNRDPGLLSQSFHNQYLQQPTMKWPDWGSSPIKPSADPMSRILPTKTFSLYLDKWSQWSSSVKL